MPTHQYLYAHALIACKYVHTVSMQLAILTYSFSLVWKAGMEIRYIKVKNHGGGGGGGHVVSIHPSSYAGQNMLYAYVRLTQAHPYYTDELSHGSCL